VKAENATWDLKAPSLIRGSSSRIKTTSTPAAKTKAHPQRPKHSTNIKIATKENKTGDKSESKSFLRGPGQWSFRGMNSKTKNYANEEDKSEQVNDDKKKEAKPQNTKSAFQRSWSFRKQNMPSDYGGLGSARPRQSNTQTKEGGTGKDKGFLPMKKSSSQNDLNVESQTRSRESQSARMTPSVSTSSIPSEVSSGKPPCVGILKTPGKRKISSSNRVEFLNNVREREIPSRHA